MTANPLSDQTRLQVRRILRARGMSQGELARRMGVSPTYISRFLNGSQSHSLETLGYFAEALGMVLSVQFVEPIDPNCPGCGAHDFAFYGSPCTHCGWVAP